MEELLTLEYGSIAGIKVNPRWPARTVLVSQKALLRLQDAQSQLAPGVSLVLTRGYEADGPLVKWLRLVARRCGAFLFCCLYPKRAKEYTEIFSPNGHDRDGNHVDVSIEMSGTPLRFLRWGVFTPTNFLKNVERDHADLLNAVWKSLSNAGFKIHSNRIEALQIHCDLNPE